MEDFPHKLKYTDDPVLCGVFSSPVLLSALRQMPCLSTLILQPAADGPHGIPWIAFKTFLSLPHLRRFISYRLSLCPKKLENDDFGDAHSMQAPLVSMEYMQYDPRVPCTFPSEREALAVVLERMSPTLERLVLPSEAAPIQSIAHVTWPRLLELKLSGDRWTTPTAPIVSLFQNMPNLRTLSIELREVSGLDARAVWPMGFVASYPWPDLEHLTVSNPDPQDLIYDHLPATLRLLSLRPWPHRSAYLWFEDYVYETRDRPRRWCCPLPSSSELLRIVPKCNTPLLQELCIEYSVDASEMLLLQQVVHSFPNLVILEVHRHRRVVDTEVPVVSLSLSHADWIRTHGIPG